MPRRKFAREMLAGDIAVVFGFDIAALIGRNASARLTQSWRVRGNPCSTSIVAFGSVYGPDVS